MSDFRTIPHLRHRQLKVFTQSDFQFNFHTIFNFINHFHNTILIRLSDGNRTPTNFENTFRFDFCRVFFLHTIPFLSKTHQKEKSDGTSEQKIISCDCILSYLISKARVKHQLINQLIFKFLKGLLQAKVALLVATQGEK